MSNCNPLKGYPCRAGPCLKNTSSVGSPAWFQIQYYRTKKINKQVRKPSSQQLLRNKSLTVTRWLAQGEGVVPTQLSMNAGGMGDLVHSIQTSSRAGIRGNKARTEKKGAKGVDEKHGSYARYLARKTGKVLRQETANSVVTRTAIVANKRTIPKNNALWFNTCCAQAADSTSQGRLPVA